MAYKINYHINRVKNYNHDLLIIKSEPSILPTVIPIPSAIISSPFEKRPGIKDCQSSSKQAKPKQEIITIITLSFDIALKLFTAR